MILVNHKYFTFNNSTYSLLIKSNGNTSNEDNDNKRETLPFRLKTENKSIYPLIVYNDINKSDIIIKIKGELKNKRGVYGFFCKVNNKIYIGSSTNLSRRFRDHMNNKHSNIKLQNAIRKYGFKQFQFIVFEFSTISPRVARGNEDNKIKDKKPLSYLEAEYLALFDRKSLYNSIYTSLVEFNHTEETIENLRILKKNENDFSFIKHHSKQTKIKISLATKGRRNPMYGKKHSNYTKNLISERQSKRLVFVYENINNKYFLVAIFPNNVKIAKWLGINKTTVGRYMKSGKLWLNKYLFKLKPIILP